MLNLPMLAVHSLDGDSFNAYATAINNDITIMIVDK